MKRFKFKGVPRKFKILIEKEVSINPITLEDLNEILWRVRNK